ncbi:Flagellin C [Candidatus Filomicrobium marinum]|uniref:Flagellin n=3 Tax=Filomicrobium TaxID=119044 RepID=A0A0D6JJF9_9HYPH|nr:MULTISPECIES: flagellin [Filomicrobium]CFX34723.1 Flagellin C [Candidatus Filomicrobium marinum]CPR21842.1 Flagellin C [Candidatus Filomicrobium marinum]SDP50483.1 flagellin [Filomicrobium insigne]
MNSINTNFAAMTALQSLNQTNKSMIETQSRISTGFRVGQASDNAAYWSMATTMRSDNKSLSAVSDALGLGAATVDVAYVAMEKSIDVMTDLQKKLVLARQPGADRAKIQTEIDELQNQLRSIASSASFTGENWLDVDTTAGSGYTASEEVVASFSRSGGSVSVSTISIDVSSTFLFNQNGAATADARGILASNRVAATGAIGAAGTIVIASTDGTAEMDISGAAVTDANIDEFITAVDQAMQEMTDAATNLGAAKSRIDLQSEFVSALSDAIDRGISTLVDADMNEESTRMQALQVQQQLGIQALSLANQNSQNILSLFR